MKSRFLGTLAMLAFGAGWAFGQDPLNAPTPSALNMIPTDNRGSVVPSQYAPAPMMPAVTNYPSMTPAPTGAVYMPETTLPSGGIVPYASADYLLWSIRGARYPAVATELNNRLVTVNYFNLYYNRLNDGTIQFNAAVTAGLQQIRILPFSLQNSSTLESGSKTNTGSQNGGRFRLGFWADTEETWGLESTFLYLSREGEQINSQPNRLNEFALNTGLTQQAFLLVQPTAQVGGGTQNAIQPFTEANNSIVLPYQSFSSMVTSVSTELLGAELNARSTAMKMGTFSFGGLAGVRWIGFRDELSITSNFTMVLDQNRLPQYVVFPGGAPTVDLSQFGLGALAIGSYDRIRIWNHFLGSQIGGEMRGQFGAVTIDTRLKVGVGTMLQTASVQSVTTQVGLGGFANTGGLLSGPADGGTHTRTRFSFVPEFNGKLGYQFTSWLKGYVGYDALYMTGVARATNCTSINTINTSLNVGGTPQNVTVAQPTFRFSDSDIWIQGISFGLEAKY